MDSALSSFASLLMSYSSALTTPSSMTLPSSQLNLLPSVLLSSASVIKTEKAFYQVALEEKIPTLFAMAEGLGSDALYKSCINIFIKEKHLAHKN
eukprot:15330031-Ditylum_brightwellii.AAC.1